MANSKGLFLLLGVGFCFGCASRPVPKAICPSVITYSTEEQKELLAELPNLSAVNKKVIQEDFGFREWARTLSCPGK